MSEDPRTEPPLHGPEVGVLRGFLDYHRETLRMKTAGLDTAQLDQALPPSSITLGGLLKHLAYVEDWWFNQVFAGGPEPELWASADWRSDPDWEWHTAADDTAEELRALFETSVAASEAVLVAALERPEGLDALSVRTSGREGTPYDLRWVLVHMIEEYARHNGHADLVRESIDGVVGE